MIRLAWLSIIAILVNQFDSNAQSSKEAQIDSLLQLIQSTDEQPLVYFELAELYSQLDSSAALRMAHQGLNVAREKQDKYGIAKGNFTLGNLNLDYNKSLDAEKYYHKADSILSHLIKADSSFENLRLWVRTNFNTNVALSYRGMNLDIEYLEKITPVAEKIGSYDILAKANTNLAINFYNTGQYRKAYKYFIKSGPQHERMDDHPTLIEDRLIFSSCLIEMDSLNRASTELNKVKILIDSLQDSIRLQIYHIILGEYFSEKGEYHHAIDNFEQAEQLLQKNKIIRNNLQLYMDFMRVYGRSEDFKNAIEYGHIALDLTKKNKNQVLEAEIYKALASYESKIGNFEEAFAYLNNFVRISDSLNIAERENEVNRLEAHYQSERKERQILQLQNENNEVELLLVRKRSQNYLLLLASISFLCLAGLAFLGYRNLRKRDQLKATVIERLKYEQDAKVSHAMLEGQENERNRIAIDLHDGLAGRLSATRIKLEQLSQGSEDAQNVKVFREAAVGIDDALSELRSIARNLMPETLFRYGLKNAIEDYCSSIRQGNSELKFILQFYDNGAVVPRNNLLTIYRIMQELVNNAVKHSKATELLIQFFLEGDKADITVEDNGVGFITTDMHTMTGMGLKNLKTRVAYLNGAIDFESNPGEGTTVHILIDTKA